MCAMRNLDKETNLAMLKDAREFLGAGVVGCDLAGDEKAYPTSEFMNCLSGRERMRFLLPFMRGSAAAHSMYRRQSSTVQDESDTVSR